MLKYMSMRMEGGTASDDLKEKVSILIEEFEEYIEQKYANIPPKIIRSKLSGSIFVFCDNDKISVFYTPKFESRYIVTESNKSFNNDEVIRDLSLGLDIDDFAVAIFPRDALTIDSGNRKSIISAVAKNHVEQQIEVFQMSGRISTFSPIFGPNSYPVQSDLVFVLMPFEEALTQIYDNVIKESIETDCKLVCRRADEIKSINPIMKDIWKSICESRVIIADLTGFNANVMYELGIAHTVGKETILLYQDTETEKKFPFDLAHIRRINYKDTAAGGKSLRADLSGTLRGMIAAH